VKKVSRRQKIIFAKCRQRRARLKPSKNKAAKNKAGENAGLVRRGF
jgi:hypothetical protein